MVDWKLTWLGHATFLIHTPGQRKIVIDPWLEGNPRCPRQYYDLPQCDLILITHGHFDHIASAADLARRTGATVVANFEIATYLEAEGVQHTVGMNQGGTWQQDRLDVSMVHAEHSSGISTEQGVRYGGDAAGFVLTLENGYSLYHAGDTNVFGDMRLIHDLYAPDLALLPIGGHFTMGPKEAAYAVRLLAPETVIPMHYGTFPALTGTPAALRDLLAETDARMVELAPGQSWPE